MFCILLTYGHNSTLNRIQRTKTEGSEEDRFFCRFAENPISVFGRFGVGAEGNRETIFLINLAQNVFEPPVQCTSDK